MPKIYINKKTQMPCTGIYVIINGHFIVCSDVENPDLDSRHEFEFKYLKIKYA